MTIDFKQAKRSFTPLFRYQSVESLRTNGPHGTSMPEYALVFALITLVVLGALTLMGGNITGFYESFSRMLSSGKLAGSGPSGDSPADPTQDPNDPQFNLLGNLTGSGSPSDTSEKTGSNSGTQAEIGGALGINDPGVDQGGQLASAGSGASVLSGAKAGGIGGVVPPPGKGERQECFSSGFCINVPEYNAPEGSTEPVGGNGGDRMHASARILEDVARQLEALDPPNPTLAALIRDAANKGHTHADKTAEMDDQARSGAKFGGKVGAKRGKEVQATRAYDDFSAQMDKVYDYMAKNPNANYGEIEAIARYEHKAIKDTKDAYNATVAKDSTAIGGETVVADTDLEINLLGMNLTLSAPVPLLRRSNNNICDTRNQLGESSQPCRR